MERYMSILSIDQGTTGTTSIIFDNNTNVLKKAYRSFKQIYPKPGWVEHDPMTIWQTVIETVEELLSDYTDKIDAIGITNQRETTLIWDKLTGEPIYNAIVWQCRRTTDICEQLKNHSNIIHSKTGLPLDAYFSATKIKWLLDNVPGFNPDNLLFGTIDSWLIWKLTNGKVHATDHTNASRTLLYNINDFTWDNELLEIFNIPDSILPQVKKSSDFYGNVESIERLTSVPILGVAGDQQAALFGQKCFLPGQSKNTYGTGCFILINTGDTAIFSDKGLLTTVAIDSHCKPCYAMEGSVFIAGAVIQWLRDELNFISNAAESEILANQVSSADGVYIVPAFVGLGAPHWNMEARGTITGLTRGSNRAHIVRAALESIAYQSYDVIQLMEEESGINIESLNVDGGATENDFLMQFQANILNRSVIKPDMAEMTALGSAMLAGLKAGTWKNTDELMHNKGREKLYTANMDETKRLELVSGWQKALRQTQAN
jgi:glycerol kinase